MNLTRATPRKIIEASRLIQQGALVAFPTETVYGLGADALNPVAVARIFEVKKRPHFDPLIVHIAEVSQLLDLAKQIPRSAFALIERFWPGPLTLVLKKKKIVPDLVTSGLDTVAVRMPNHPVALSLIRESKTPIAAPSANPFSYLSPTCAKHVADPLGDKVDMILDGGPCAVGVESTVLDISGKHPSLLRPGGIPLEDLEEVLGRVQVDSQSNQVKSPGQLRYHYAPHTPIYLVRRSQWPRSSKKNIGYLAFNSFSSKDFKKVEVLSRNGNLLEASSRLFECLHRLDRLNLDAIWAEEVPHEGLGLAIMDRLKKAAQRHFER